MLKTHVIRIDVSSQNELFEKIADNLHEHQVFSCDKNIIINAYKEREEQGTTNLGEGFAFPHILINKIKVPTILIVQLENEIMYGDSNIDLAIVLAFPKTMEGGEHLRVISKYSEKLLDEKFLKNLRKAKPAQLKKELTDFNKHILSTNEEKITHHESTLADKNAEYKVVAISSCPTGIAHTHLAADALTKAAKELGIGFKIERQAAGGTQDHLSSKEIDEADYVLFAVGKDIDKSRFIGKKTMEIGIGESIKNPKKTLKDLPEKATVYAAKKGEKANDNSNLVKPGVKLRHRNPVMNALMNGLSYMIPIVITGGLLLAIGIGLGLLTSGQSDPTKIPHTNFFWVVQSVGGAAFTIMIPVLGAYIAYAIGDRPALTPGFILSFLLNIGPDSTGHNYALWNWESLSFGVTGQSALGFFGAIAAGLLCGYSAKFLSSLKYPKAVRNLVPLMFIPLVTTFGIWLLFSFGGYLPLYYLSVGLQDLINTLVSHNLFWIMGVVLGLMITFDMGGPVNKIAMFIAIGELGHQQYLLMGANGVAIATPPIGMAFGVLMSNLIRRNQPETEKELAKTAAILGTFGITEGAIPFVIKNPRLIIANLAGGAVGGGIAGLAKIGNLVGHGGIIVWLLGAVGHQPDGATALSDNYTYGLIYILALLAGSLTTGLIYMFMYKPSEDKNLATVLD
ncbi:hypothetical protein ASO20_02945 [Mycoplasma sp. (ex Biomphalaria glabrata)]|uniref:PTS fructose transporter subunit IIABC n=1 Tax=Mycoplasma sp. (ex Biomphalaria glabrata) TaxID=1749074 RepID=UPI00073A5938|nr:fructose-specific PTS transporter subunit EIIC [Mycoplasma sp. (ex Biomphalaria glabrata)]ALV23590.1 hypothetical protein ASO20_02945 [Mycoplasma sp. (ex Biomphalaria glabrata)]